MRYDGNVCAEATSKQHTSLIVVGGMEFNGGRSRMSTDYQKDANVRVPTDGLHLALRRPRRASGLCKDQAVSRVRVMTYNILMGGRNGADLNRVVRAAAPDVLLVNESPKTPFLWKRRARRLADAWDMRYVVGGRPAGSNMITTAPTVGVKARGAETIDQPLFQPRRGIAWAQLRVEGRLLGVVCCHLSLDRPRRLAEVDRVLEVAVRLRGPVVIGGDLNETPGGPVWQKLARAGYVDHGSRRDRTYPAVEPVKRIDALLVRGAADVLDHGVPDLDPGLLAAASDHLPIVATLRLR